jgi:NAD(P)-dependent dehydrogenase (short-subunit alcohol dehydrogenase family)
MPKESKVWLVTGCSRGLGRAIAEALLAAGERLVATARSVEDLAFLDASDRLHKVALDVTDADAARDAVEEAVAAFGRLDVVVNNAGFSQGNSVEDLPEQDFRKQVEINFFGAYHLAHAALPVLHAQRAGHIIFVASIGARVAIPGFGAYQAGKAAVGALADTLAAEVAPFGVKVTCLEPGGMRTDMFSSSIVSDSMSPEYDEIIGTPMRAVFDDKSHATSDPAKVAALILRIASEPEPPIRLLVGSDAYKQGTEVLAARLKADERWKALSLSTDYGAT